MLKSRKPQTPPQALRLKQGVSCLRVNSGLFAHGYWLKAASIEGGLDYSVGVMQFAKDDGTKLDPSAIKPRTFTIQADTPEGRESWNGK